MQSLNYPGAFLQIKPPFTNSMTSKLGYIRFLAMARGRMLADDHLSDRTSSSTFLSIARRAHINPRWVTCNHGRDRKISAQAQNEASSTTKSLSREIKPIGLVEHVVYEPSLRTEGKQKAD